MHIVKKYHAATVGEKSEYQFEFFCKLFEDMIATELCFARRTHFNGHNVFSCRGCSKDTILNSLHNRTRSSESGS